MRQILTVFVAMLALLSAGGLYLLKHEVEARRGQVVALEKQIVRDAEALRVLEAEWAYLASPQLVQDRVVRNLRLRPATPDQIVSSLTALPYRLDRHVLAAVTGDDIRPVPSPRTKPAVPYRPNDDAQAGVLAVAQSVPADGRQAVLSSRLSVFTPPDGAGQDFAARMQRAIDRVGGDR